METHNVLVIDAETPSRERLKNFLDKQGYTTFTAENYQRGLDVFDKENLEIVIVDVKKPTIDCIEVIKKIKEKSRESEVILINGHGDAVTTIQTLENGAFRYLREPTQYDELKFEINRALYKIEIGRKLNDYKCDLERITVEKESERNLRKRIEEKMNIVAKAWMNTFNTMTEMIFSKDDNIINDNRLIIGLEPIVKDISEIKKTKETPCANAKEFEKLHRIIMGRELRIAELKEEVERLKNESRKLGRIT